MQTLKTLPVKDGFHMPGEFEPHKGTVLIWPVRPGSWTNGGLEAQPVFAKIARTIAKHEECYLLCKKSDYEKVRKMFENDKNIFIYDIETDDAWARDIGPTCLINKDGIVRGVDWKFNAWGGDYDGLYLDYENDDAAASAICQRLDIDCYDAKHFVLEGGSIHSDGEGTVIVTEACLLSKGRNPELTKEEIEEQLKDYLGAEKIIWLPRGIEGDETNEHVDNVCAFVRPREVVLAWTDDENDIQWKPSNESLKTLEKATDAKGRHFLIHKMLIPKNPVTITKDEIEALEFEPGEDTREVGERLAASYVNFYIANNAVLVPQFNDVNDSKAMELFGQLFPEREIVPIPARPIIVGGGNIHCITQQIPRGK